MFDLSASVFGQQKVTVPADCKYVFVSDLFVGDYVGGAELTSQALIDAAPSKVFKLHSNKVTEAVISENADKFWIFGNFANMDPRCIQYAVCMLSYTVLEYDYKYCRARSPEKHFHMVGRPCDCHNQQNGRLIEAFYAHAKHVWWMSKKQMEKYFTVLPSLDNGKNTVLSSVFSEQTFENINRLNILSSPTKRSGWIVLGSDSWVKGFEAAKKWCEDNKKQYEVVWNLPYEKLLEKLSTAEGFVYLPAGSDTCPRMVIEAKLLGCKLILNENVQHADERWFDTDMLLSIQQYLSHSPKKFWDKVTAIVNSRPTISGYTTVYNAIKQEYPFKQCIASMLTFCDEVCVVDGGSADGTWESLQQMAASEPRIKIKQVIRDWKAPNHPVFDGMQKAEARKMCTSEFCWQMDSDEIVHEADGTKIKTLCDKFPQAKIVALPVIEYWCGSEKVRCDIHPWKWRLSKNDPRITHGIPGALRFYVDNLLYSRPGSDGCDMIDSETLEPIQTVNFYTREADSVRLAALNGNTQALCQYEAWYNDVVSALPSVFHYSWYDMPRKMRLYRDYWQNHWMRLSNLDDSDSAENNKFFGVPWSQVTDEMIAEKSKQLSQIGGWIWHRKWDGQYTPSIRCFRNQPMVMSSGWNQK